MRSFGRYRRLAPVPGPISRTQPERPQEVSGCSSPQTSHIWHSDERAPTQTRVDAKRPLRQKVPRYSFPGCSRFVSLAGLYSLVDDFEEEPVRVQSPRLTDFSNRRFLLLFGVISQGQPN